ncbi:MAG TPA: 4-hydroxythreonine-4-phosphate dehydrogenase PdxA [Candidatus Krumholzibacterium sp.]|nr:4-hydroxythreonine-4-phosphate dehydrogenase PdxA [Candidatus Krumholzibacterium sp.]
MSDGRIRLALTIGDPAGVGPEIAAAMLRAEEPGGGEELLLIGSATALRRHLPPGPAADMTVVAAGGEGSAEDIAGSWNPSGRLTVIDTAGDARVPEGRPSREGGLVAGRAIEIAAALASRGKVDGIVTGPVSKEGLRLAGYPWNGHTSMLADLMHSPDCQMMMVSAAMRIVILTRDIPLREVPDAVTGERIITGTRVTAEALRSFWGIAGPRILVSALNPHAGDGGVTGSEEIEKIIPAIEKLRAEGLDVTGPVPADTLFCRWAEKKADAFIALYHDIGMIPFKMEGFAEGVNMTIGLPVVRTSVCHGTAYDIAGRGSADHGSLVSAVRLAGQCAATSRKTVETK